MSRAQGSAYEQQVADWLVRQNLQIVERNYHCRGGEIDIIALDGKQLCFIEIRARSTHRAALESVDLRKQQKTILAASVFLAGNPKLAKHVSRFDVIAVDTATKKPLWIKAAYTL